MIEPISLEQLQQIGDRQVVASVSGGKDSTALCLWLQDNNIPFIALFADTGWEHPITYKYLRETLPQYIGPIIWVQGERQMVELIRHKKIFPSRMMRFCTEELKVKPIIQYFSERLDEGIDCINAVGIRWAESKARSTLGEWEWNKGFDAETWRPLLKWTEQDVIDIIREHDVPPNPLYLKGASRVGCYPCIFARKAEIRFVAEKDPYRIAEIAALEKELGEGARERALAKNKIKFRLPTYFQGKAVDEDGKGIGIPIDKAVEWSMTDRKGNRVEILADAPEGCMKWGLCDNSSETEEDEVGRGATYDEMEDLCEERVSSADNVTDEMVHEFRAWERTHPEFIELQDPALSQNELRHLARDYPKRVLTHPNCPEDIWATLAVEHPSYVEESPTFYLQRLEEEKL